MGKKYKNGQWVCPVCDGEFDAEGWCPEYHTNDDVRVMQELPAATDEALGELVELFSINRPRVYKHHTMALPEGRRHRGMML